MFCDACGAQVQGNQRFCGTCGKPLGKVVAGKVSSRVADHIQILGVLWIVYSMVQLIGAVIVFMVANTLLPHFASIPPPPGTHMPPGAFSFIQPLITFISILLLGKALLAASAGIGLLQKQSWGRMVALVIAFVALINIPFGTGVGIYTLWVLLPSNGQQDYAKISSSSASA